MRKVTVACIGMAQTRNGSRLALDARTAHDDDPAPAAPDDAREPEPLGVAVPGDDDQPLGAASGFAIPTASDDGAQAPDGGAIPAGQDPERDLRDFSAYVFDVVQRMLGEDVRTAATDDA